MRRGSVRQVGITTDAIDKLVFAACVERGCYPSPLNYGKFPKSLCTCAMAPLWSISCALTAKRVGPSTK